MDQVTQQPFASDTGPTTGLTEQVPEAVLHLRSAVRSGTPWPQAMLEAAALWTLPQEVHQGRSYQYLIQGEAFDWLVLAERLCTEIEGFISDEEKERLLFWGMLPDETKPEALQDLLGVNKYRAYLNYWYGVVVEEALQLSVEEDVRKRHLALCYSDSEDLVENAFVLLYGATRAELLEEFRDWANIARRRTLSLVDLKGFNYWLHKRRLKMWDPARVASDTKRGIRRLRLLEQSARGRQDSRQGTDPTPKGT
tara:strand:- start:524 stop:1282 length:759 start_codon:yes stop_codon:yes gene_type:complete